MFKYFFILLVTVSLLSRAQESIDTTVKITLSLRNVIGLAVTQSSAIKYSQNRNVNYYWRWKNFKTSSMPQLTLSGDLPEYVHRSDVAVQQDDGSIKFRKVSQIEMNSTLALSQSLPFTNSYIYAASSVKRLQDFINNTTNYSGPPFSIGLHQPLFALNWMKWNKKTEPLIYEEAQKEFVESVEEISYEATNRFFRYLQIQTNYNLAESNLKNSEDNLRIAEVKRKIGDISENDFSRITLSVLNAQKALNKARMDLKNADFELKSYVGLDPTMKIELIMPLEMYLFEVDVTKALDEARENRKETPYLKRRVIEAERDLIQAKKAGGLNIALNASYGLSKSADEYFGIFDEPEKSRQFGLTVNVPIMDWGRSESRIKMAESRRDLVLYDVEREKTNFERSIVVEVEQFNLLRDQINTAKEADKVAENGYQISLRKFQNGEISITDLNISLSERESAKRDYISSLERYWESYYYLRILTLYDFEMQSKISVDNPMLSGD
ncbi:MAG: TolC family protein [Bacteroidales bacterium]